MINNMNPDTLLKKYCNSLTSYSRYLTREVKIGNIALGGNNPLRVQSMTTTDTMDTIATVEQSIRIIEAGSDYVRITAPSINEAKNLAYIAGGTGGLFVLEISPGGQPRLVGRRDTPGFAKGVAVEGSRAYVADSENGLVILDGDDAELKKEL